MASPFTQSIGMFGPALARAAAGSRARARTIQPWRIRAAAAWAPKEPVAPMIRAVRLAAGVEVVAMSVMARSPLGRDQHDPFAAYSELPGTVGLICRNA